MSADIWYYLRDHTEYAEAHHSTWNVRLFSAPINLLLTLNYSLNFYLSCLANKYTICIIPSTLQRSITMSRECRQALKQVLGGGS